MGAFKTRQTLKAQRNFKNVLMHFLQFSFIFKNTFCFAPKLRIEKLSGRNFGAFLYCRRCRLKIIWLRWCKSRHCRLRLRPEECRADRLLPFPNIESRYGLFWLNLLMIKANLYYFGGISAYGYQVPLRGSKREL